MVVLFAAVAFLATEENGAAQRGRTGAEEFVTEGVPRMPTPPGPAPKRDLSGAWVGPQNNKPDPVPPMTPAGQAQFKLAKAYGTASRTDGLGESNDPFITCDPLGFPRNLLAHAITQRGGTLFATAPNRIIIAYEQQRVWREVWMDGRALPKAVDVKGAPESRYYGYSVVHWENDNTLVINTVGVSDMTWLDKAGHPHSVDAKIEERFTRPDHNHLQMVVTVDDPKVFTKPFVLSKNDYRWIPDQEAEEQMCVPSEMINYMKTISDPAFGTKNSAQ